MNAENISIRFFRLASGREPVREWLKDLGRPDSLTIGEDIRLAQISWPLGLPHCRPMGGGLYEIRSSLVNGRIARVLFFFCAGEIILLHGFIKKTLRIPPSDLKLAGDRRAAYMKCLATDGE
jgi:phage-related protein